MILGVIPARYQSSRFPGKVLAPLCGKPMVVWVYERAKQCKKLDELVVATDSDDVVAVCAKYDIPVRRSSPSHQSGTDRCVEVATKMRASRVVNIQGDEPLITPAHIEAVINSPGAVATLSYPLAEGELENPNVVKVVSAGQWKRALYFSRQPLPGSEAHVGIYAYTGAALGKFSRKGPTMLEQAERLEQLRFLELGIMVTVEPSPAKTYAVDTPADLSVVEAILRGPC